MAVSTTATSVTYSGNGSTVNGYTIPFQFLDSTHIKLAIAPDEDSEPVLQSPSAYSVVGTSLFTVSAQAAGKVLTIFRATPITQPSVFQIQGPFPAKNAETALDRECMQIQEINTRLVALEGVDDLIPQGISGDKEVAIWADSTARAIEKPVRAGQIGVERSSGTIWIAASTTAGDWIEYGPHFSNRVSIALLSDAGAVGDNQNALAEALNTWVPDAVLFAGDNNYAGLAQYENDWAAFIAWINLGRAFPALGNHDVDEDGWEDALADLFPYLPGNKRYYTVSLGAGLVDVFVLNSGRNSVFDLVEDDGNDTSSVQHAWFVTALAASRSRWKIAVFHHPPATCDSRLDRIEPNMDWPELARMDLILCGHTHMTELLKYSGTLLANISATTSTAAEITGALTGGEETDSLLWVDTESTILGRLVASHEKLTLELWEVGVPYVTRRLVHTRDVRDLSRRPLVSESFTIFKADETVTFDFDDTIFVHVLARPVLLRSVRVSTAHVVSTNLVNWTLRGGAVDLATGSVADTDDPVYESVEDCLLPYEVIPAGTVLSILLTSGSGSGRKGLEVGLAYQPLT